MFFQGKAHGLGHGLLTLLNLGIEKLFHPTALHADEVIVVISLIEFKYRFARLKVLTRQNAGLLKLRKHPVNSCQTDVQVLFEQQTVNVFGAEVPMPPGLKNIQDFQARNSGFQAAAFQVGGIWHRRAQQKTVQLGYDIGFTQITVARPTMPQTSKTVSVLSRAVLVASLCALQACGGYVPNIIAPYRPDIQQGNVVIESTLNQLKPGMSQEQVRFILGSPLLVDPFHADRWDYIYRYQTGKGQIENSRITIVFKDGLYTEHVGKPMPDIKR